MARPSNAAAVDPVAWARAQRYTMGRACTLCSHPEMGSYARAIIKEWASGRIKPWALSWPKVAIQIRETFHTRTHWISVRNHFRDHESELYARLERRRRGD